MTVTHNFRHHRAGHLFAALAAVTLLWNAPPAQADWIPSRGTTILGGLMAAGVGWSLRKNIGEATDRLREVFDAADRGNAAEFNRISGEFGRLGGKIGMDASPVLSIGAGALNVARDAGEKIKETLGRLAGKAGETFGDARAALAIDPDERQLYESNRVLGKTRLPAVTVSRTRREPDPYAGSMARAWGMDAETVRRSRDPAAYAGRPDPWGQDAGQGRKSSPSGPVATTTDVWADDDGEHEQNRHVGASTADADPWGQDAGKVWDSPSGLPVAADAGDKRTDTEWQSEYSAALNHFLGLDEDDSSYEAALKTVERLELEAVRRQEERERQARLEAQERERLARLEKRRRLEAQERERQANLERQRRNEAASRQRMQQTLQNINRTATSLGTVVNNAAAAVRNSQSGSGRRGNARKEKHCRSGYSCGSR